MQKVSQVLLPKAGRYLCSQCLCLRSSSSLSKSHFRGLDGGSVDLSKDGASGIATILINHPGKKNALSGKMMLDMEDCVGELEKWNAGKGVVLAGSNGTFCSGGYLKTVQEIVNHGDEMSELMQSITSRLLNLPLISLAVVNGHAIGGGAELLTACDFRIAKPSAKIGFVQTKMNVATGWGGCTRLVELVGRTNTLHLLMSGTVLDADAAFKIGLIDEVIEEEGDVTEQGKQWLKKNCVGNTDTSRVLKQMVLGAVQLDKAESYRRERQLFCEVWGKRAHIEALNLNKKHHKK